ncbi:MAG: response regulator [Thermoleophilia bacterium]|jgi:DNA-binding response OmpR family regulator|nr:response regulator [Thermoleophilia bacterium]
MNDIRLLLVDDEEEFVEALKERLNMRDLDGHVAFSGMQALEFVEENEPDVIILDLKMPGIDGMEVLRRVRKNYPAIQIIVHTGAGNDLDEIEARRLGVFDYLKKPADIDLLVDRIRAAYQRRDEQ